MVVQPQPPQFGHGIDLSHLGHAQSRIKRMQNGAQLTQTSFVSIKRGIAPSTQVKMRKNSAVG